ncbi:CRTAC1 family protein [Thalassoroseus pseudoceratinae]|uniref:CRTAC1 family protein n=1 Tax=Thalassoroseus pseudoceratinae TaxID=2713176 RepID=UPI0014221AE7|nr:CRTAC1 family protein [Thalassoroseus pseudoceratinae]
MASTNPGLRLILISSLAMASWIAPSSTNIVSAQELPFVFRDVSQETGLQQFLAGIQGHGAAWGDVDSDGWPELYTGTFHYPDTSPNRLLRNNRGRFRLDQSTVPRISTRATGVLFADFDNDGDLDLYVASMPGPEGSRLATRVGRPIAGCSLFRNTGNGAFENVSEGNAACPKEFGGRSATVLDYDGDGLLDLLVGEDPMTGYNGSSTHSSRLFRNEGQLQFADVSQDAGIPTGTAGLGVASADVNLDGWPDVFLASTLGNLLLINDGAGHFTEPSGIRNVFAWPDAKGDNMVCGVTFGDVNNDRLPDVVIGQHFDSPWKTPVANRLYLNRGISKNNMPRFEDVTEAAGLKPLPLKAPHVEIQDFDNDGRADIYTSIVKFADQQPHPMIYRNTGISNGVPTFEESVLAVNDFPTDADRGTRGSRKFFEKMISEKKIIYTAPGPSGDFDQDGRLDLFLASWWPEAPSMLLRNETAGGHWLDVRVIGPRGVNRMGIGSRIELYEPGRLGDSDALISSRQIQVGFGYASGQEAIAHFGLGERKHCDILVTYPSRADLTHELKTTSIRNVEANQRLTVRPTPSQ